jgi:hypothetical protein
LASIAGLPAVSTATRHSLAGASTSASGDARADRSHAQHGTFAPAAATAFNNRWTAAFAARQGGQAFAKGGAAGAGHVTAGR